MKFNDHAYILHTRAYRETSQLVELFSKGHGRFTAVARGRAKNLSRQPFYNLDIVCSGKAELKTLISAEATACSTLRGNSLYIGLYLNELLMRLLPNHQGHHRLFEHYALLIKMLEESAGVDSVNVEGSLRRFEFHLLQELGYGFSLEADEQGNDIDVQQYYRFQPDQGFAPTVLAPTITPLKSAADQSCFLGKDLLAMAEDQFDQSGVKRSAKRLMRLALAPHLGGKPLISRELFRG